MKHFFWYTVIVLLINATAKAQTKSKGTSKQHTVSSKAVSVNRTKANKPFNSNITVTLNSTSVNLIQPRVTRQRQAQIPCRLCKIITRSQILF
jgi:hypothetical protein